MSNTKQKSRNKGITAKKDENFSEWFSQVVQKAELADIRYGVQGFIVHHPWAVRLSRKVYDFFEQAVEADGHEPMLFPTVIPEDHLQKEAEHAGFVPEVFWITHAGEEKLERRLALRPTGETQIYPMYSLWIRSYQDLPFKRYQSRISAFRNEMATRPFMRGREFMFFETHDVFGTHEDAMKQIYTDMRMMTHVIEHQLLLPFVFLRRPKWDTFKGAEWTFAGDTLHPDGRRSQISSTHDLGTRFAEAFDVTYTDQEGIQRHGHQTCFGPGVWRIIAAIVAIHGDDKGLVLPFDIAPVQIVVIPILFAGRESENVKVINFCRKLCDSIKQLGYQYYLDDREGITPGEKYNIWELKGVPLRLEVGPREAETKIVTAVRRTDKDKEQIDSDKHIFGKELAAQAEKINDSIRNRSEAYFKECTRSASTLAEIKSVLKNHPGFVKSPWCSVEMDGEQCADVLKAQTSAYVCGTPLKEDKADDKCAVCGKDAKHIVYIAKSI
jgi:prolyl-tRNA synthetase